MVERTDPDHPWTDRAWQAIKNTVSAEGETHEWDFAPANEYLFRFLGNLEGFTDFQSLADELFALFCEVDKGIDGPRSYWGWLIQVFEIAYTFPTDSLEWKGGLWGYDGKMDDDMFATLVEQDVVFDGVTIPKYPFFTSLKEDVWKSSISAINLFLDPYSAAFDGDDPFPVRLPWLLSATFACPTVLDLDAQAIADSKIKQHIVAIYMITGWHPKPHFDGRHIWLDGTILRDIRSGSEKIKTIVQAFEDRNWPNEIDTPLGGQEEHYQATRDVAAKLNRCQMPVQRIIFKAGSGKQISWCHVDDLFS